MITTTKINIKSGETINEKRQPMRLSFLKAECYKNKKSAVIPTPANKQSKPTNTVVVFFAKALVFHSVARFSHSEARFLQSSIHSFADSSYFSIKSMRAFSRSSGVSFPRSTDFTASLMLEPAVVPSSSIFVVIFITNII